MRNVQPTPVPSPYKPRFHVRIVTAASLFDGHDAAINVMRRLMQASGAEVIHLGHNRSVDDVVRAALQEDVHGLAISSYQGGHVEYFSYLLDRLREEGIGDVKVYGGGGGVIVPSEIELLESRGIAKIFSPHDGQQLGLRGMINLMIAACDRPLSADTIDPAQLVAGSQRALARTITLLENDAVG
ncbi:MAG: cobalamin-dependent protein, partial [Cystobacter sp.]